MGGSGFHKYTKLSSSYNHVLVWSFIQMLPPLSSPLGRFREMMSQNPALLEVSE